MKVDFYLRFDVLFCFIQQDVYRISILTWIEIFDSVKRLLAWNYEL